MALTVKRVVVTGANGSGKTHFAQKLSKVLPSAEVVSFDALKLTTDWVQRPKHEVQTALEEVVAQDSWILEGGPTLLELALERADVVVWLDTPLWKRAGRLLTRPWKHRGTTRPELPEGNVDWPLQQLWFALRSISLNLAFRRDITSALNDFDPERVFRCKRTRDLSVTLKRLGRI